MTHPDTLTAREKKAAFAASLAIDEALTTRIVHSFYDRIRADEILGPIFSKHIQNWDPHLARMVDFWMSIMVESGRFNGNPMVKHVAIGGLTQMHFDRWLDLFNRTAAEIAPSKEAALLFMEKADMIGQSLSAGIEAHEMRMGVRPSKDQ